MICSIRTFCDFEGLGVYDRYAKRRLNQLTKKNIGSAFVCVVVKKEPLTRNPKPYLRVRPCRKFLEVTDCLVQ